MNNSKNNSTTLTFRRPELPQIRIENFVSLYNSGLFDEVQYASNDLTNQIGITNAFKKQILTNIISKFKVDKKQKRAFSKFVHLIPHKHSNILHHTHCHKQLSYFPLQYFVARQHSGFSVPPYKNVWAKHKDTVETLTIPIDNNMERMKPSSSSLYFKLSRIERTEELQIHPLLACCQTTRIKSLRPTKHFVTQICAMRTSLKNCRTQTQHQSIEKVFYQVLRRVEDVEHVPIEQFIFKHCQTADFARNKIQKQTTLSHNGAMIYDLHPIEDTKYIPVENYIQFSRKYRTGNNSEERKRKKNYYINLKNLNFPVLSSLAPSSDLKENGAKKEKKKKANKKDKKQKKNLTAGAEALSTSTSSNSSTSSSSEAEAEKVHILEQQKSDAHPKKHIVEGSAAPGHTTVETWHEETVGPEQVTTEIDEQENIIKRIVRSEQIKHTVQTQSYQTVIVPENDAEELSKIGTEISSPVLNSGMLNGGRNENDLLTQDELVSSKVITTGNRTVETLTYKTEKNGIVETRVEHRITIHSNEEIDHDAELGEAIMEVTNMNPELKVEKVQVERSDGSA